METKCRIEETSCGNGFNLQTPHSKQVMYVYTYHYISVDTWMRTRYCLKLACALCSNTFQWHLDVNPGHVSSLEVQQVPKEEEKRKARGKKDARKRKEEKRKEERMRGR